MKPRRRYFVPDLSPADRPEVGFFRPRIIFVAESPHTHEIACEAERDRRPLCGAAGRKWWALLGKVSSGEAIEDVSAASLIEACRKTKVAVMNAVQYPLDPKIARVYPDADPVSHLGFAKMSGPHSFKKNLKSPAFKRALESLRTRLQHPSVSKLPIYCLGNDAIWIVEQALGPDEFHARVQGKIPHPSAWWRKQGIYGKIAEQKLREIFS